jgi:carboxyl-terminal processing protease
VFILAGPGSCSASESIINGLRGIDVQVVLVGGNTCGKPFGFTAKDNCGISYFPIEFQGVNAKGFGDYANGFAPTCAVADDLSRQLGDPSERMLAAALSYRTTGSCPVAASSGSQKPGVPQYTLLRHPVRESKVLH